jgi:hypothetical protein
VAAPPGLEARSISDDSTTASDSCDSAQRVLTCKTDNRPGWKHCYRSKVEKVLRRCVAFLEESDLIAHVEMSSNANDLSVYIQVQGHGGLLVDYVSTLAQETLIESISQSKCIFIMGYCSPQPFTVRPFGFEASLAAMENATKACWHVFKKGFCKHGLNCSKQHPIYTIPLRVFVQPSGFCAPPPLVSMNDPKFLIGGFVHSLATMLEHDARITGVQALGNHISNGWTLEVSLEAPSEEDQQDVLDTIQQQVLAITSSSCGIHIVEYAGRQFVQTSTEFAVLLGASMFDSLEIADFVVSLNVVIKPS